MIHGFCKKGSFFFTLARSLKCGVWGRFGGFPMVGWVGDFPDWWEIPRQFSASNLAFSFFIIE
jgi:hypothetical protein